MLTFVQPVAINLASVVFHFLAGGESPAGATWVTKQSRTGDFSGVGIQIVEVRHFCSIFRVQVPREPGFSANVLGAFLVPLARGILISSNP